MNLKTATVVFGFLAPLSAGTVSAADLHPIIKIGTGYFFGASENGKWIKAEQAAKSTGKKTTYQVYGLTKQAGQITAAKPKSVDEPCPDGRVRRLNIAGLAMVTAEKPSLLVTNSLCTTREFF